MNKVKRVQVDMNPATQAATSPIDWEDELAQVSCLLEEIWDEAIATAERVRVIDTQI